MVSAPDGESTQVGAELGGDIGLHELGGHRSHRLAQYVTVSVDQQLVGRLGSVATTL
jgi:hypothetical protein